MEQSSTKILCNPAPLGLKAFGCLLLRSNYIVKCPQQLQGLTPDLHGKQFSKSPHHRSGREGSLFPTSVARSVIWQGSIFPLVRKISTLKPLTTLAFHFCGGYSTSQYTKRKRSRHQLSERRGGGTPHKTNKTSRWCRSRLFQQ